MAQFHYKALESNGAMTEGAVEAGSRGEALRLIDSRGLRPVNLEETATSEAPWSLGQMLHSRKRIGRRGLENFTRQLSSLLEAGISLSRALLICQREAASEAAAQKWGELNERVADGAALADAMAGSPDVFPRVYVAMVQAGEAGGFLSLVLAQIAEFQSREAELKSRVYSALIYPAILAFLAVAVLIFLLVFFIPRFQGIFSDFGGSLPLLTRMVVGASQVVSRYAPLAVLVVVVGALAIRRWLSTEAGRRQWEHGLLRAPILGALTARFAMVRFCRMLGTLVGAGVPLIQSLRVARESLGNQTLVDAVSDSIERVQQGEGLAESLEDCRELFPGSVIEMITVAEETGRLDGELVRQAEVAETELDRMLRATVALAEPLLLFIMAAFIGTIVIGMVLPIFTIQDLIN